MNAWDFGKWFVQFVYEHWFLTWMFLWVIFGHCNLIKYSNKKYRKYKKDE